MMTQLKIRKTIALFLLVCFLIFSEIVSAHSNLENLTQSEISKIQIDLVKQGYLDKNQFTPGVANTATDEAYDKFQTLLRIKKYEYATSSQTVNTKTATDTTVVSAEVEKPNFFTWMLENLLKYFGF